MKISNFRFSQRSDNNLKGVNPDLVKVVRRALELSVVDFGVIEGLRTVERQKWLVATGKSQTMNGRHLTGHAIDVFAYPTVGGSWEWKYYEQIASAFKQAAKDVGVPIEWGGDWQTLKDGPHFQLPFKDYPA
ncbi:D-alanyl-D-alanine carboxypeptidase family protein [Yersinia pseudotuberculosis]|nr:D-alanyl-D-alanine carboxypeptidase family protein [Yersinia pseudotuberculosis]CNJ99630.1 peptidase M15B and M15C DD-carboxypeptidase VanY/endolysin [Yersinia pseudotuberculosis]CQH36091.1 peptidase M15B and M15C DD-carboxypeptidase VanY/endolysin [Yersinia pseudotuberculosis]